MALDVYDFLKEYFSYFDVEDLWRFNEKHPHNNNNNNNND